MEFENLIKEYPLTFYWLIASIIISVSVGGLSGSFFVGLLLFGVGIAIAVLASSAHKYG